MTKSPAKPKPVRVGRYRYSKLRWRLLVHALDFCGTILMAIVRMIRPARTVEVRARILVVQLDHLGDAVLSTPLIAELRAAYPEAAIDVLASPSNHEVFEADPDVNRVKVAERTWFERRPDRWGLLTAVWNLGWSLRRMRLRPGHRRARRRADRARPRPGRSSAPGRLGDGRRGLLADRRGRLDSRAPRGPLAAGPARSLWESRPTSQPGSTSTSATRIGSRSPAGSPRRGRAAATSHVGPRSMRSRRRGRARRRWARRDGQVAPSAATESISDVPDWLHADRFSSLPPLLAVHLGAGNAAKRWPTDSWKVLIERFLESGWRVVVVGGVEDAPLSRVLEPHDRLRDWTGSLTVTQTTALLERADLFIGADSGPAHLAASAGTLSVILFSGTNQPRQWRPWSRHSLVLRHRVPCQPCHQKVCPLADHPCMSGLSPDRVYRGAMRLWSRTHRAESPHAPM